VLAAAAVGIVLAIYRHRVAPPEPAPTDRGDS
jgi:hypothetical protein